MALEPTQTSAGSQDSSLEVASRSGIMALSSASPPNSAEPPRAKESAQSDAIEWAAGEVVATLAKDRLVQRSMLSRGNADMAGALQD